MTTLKKICIACSIILIIFLVLYYGFNMRYYTFFNVDQFGENHNIKDSKFIGVYLCEYKPEKKCIYINNNHKITIKESWAEKIWTYTSDFRKPDTSIVCEADCQLILTFGKNDLKFHRIIWRLEEMRAPTYKQNYGNLLWNGMKYNELKDTLYIKILKKNPQTNEFTESIGVIRFFKVKE